MLKELVDLLSFRQTFVDGQVRLKYKIDFLNSVFLMAVLIAFGMGFYRWQQSPIMGMIDFGFSAIGIACLYYLKRNKEKVDFISTLAIVLAYMLFLAIYVLAPYNTMRLSLFFLLSAAVFFLKGRQTGLYWLGFILLTVVTVHLLPGFSTGYLHIDIITTCLYLVALFAIFWNYETVRERQDQREQEHHMQSLVDQRWRLALEGTGDAIWDWNISTNKLTFSNSYADMLGYTETEIDNSLEHLECLLHPADKPEYTANLNAYLGGDGSEQYVAEVRLRCKDDSYKWILRRGRVIQRDRSGRLQRMVGTHTDVTQRKLAEEEILRSRQALDDERGLFQVILDNAPLGIWMVDPRGKLQFVNSRFCNDTGIPEKRFLSAKRYYEVLPRPIAESCLQSDKQCFGQKEPCVSMEWLPFVDGRDHLLEITKVRIRNNDGSIRGLVGLAVDVTDRVEHEKELETIAHFDALTGVPNRVLLMDRLSQALARTKRDAGMTAVCYLDLDGFKSVNDAFGHEAGDKVLVKVARCIKEVIRESDTVARLGGDEFVVLLVGLQGPEECEGTLARLLHVIRQPIDHGGKSLNVSASIGVAFYSGGELDADTLLRHADQAMYVAKRRAKNCYHVFEAEDND